MTERSEGIRRRVPVVTLSDEGGLMTERSEGVEDAALWSRSPTKEGS
ncbi:hypothetical protein OG417_43155 [Actinoallomurus sp. NBC_01490]|nr:hypothetical protein [Actinoallomurus sp. NBC_01490]